MRRLRRTARCWVVGAHRSAAVADLALATGRARSVGVGEAAAPGVELVAAGALRLDGEERGARSALGETKIGRAHV